MWRELRELGAELRDDPELRALVVIGEGRAFSSGIDTSVFAGDTLDGDTLETDRDAPRRHDDPAVDAIMQTQDAYTWLEEAPYATIAAVRGYARGAGLQLALACDVRVFAEGTKAGLLEFKYGILPDLGGTQRLPRAVGAAKAKELIFTAGQIDADEAFRIGLTQRLVPDAEPESTARELAATNAAQPPPARESAKRAVNVAGAGPPPRGGAPRAPGPGPRPLTPEAPYELVTRMRASINVLGPLLARCGEARVAMPGGDNIGSRKLDMHFRGLQAMGAELDIVHGLIEARCRTLCGARIVLDFPSVGATENLLTAAVLAKGQTVLDNAAREPEISDLAAFLNGMGAQISGAGSSTIEVEGVESLTPIENEVMGDRIEAGTILMACGVAGGEVTVEGTRLDHLEMVALKLGEMGLDVSPTPDGLSARCDERLRAVDGATLPYPRFATDFMPLVVAPP